MSHTDQPTHNSQSFPNQKPAALRFRSTGYLSTANRWVVRNLQIITLQFVFGQMQTSLTVVVDLSVETKQGDVIVPFGLPTRMKNVTFDSEDLRFRSAKTDSVGFDAVWIGFGVVFAQNDLLAVEEGFINVEGFFFDFFFGTYICL